MEVIPGVPSQWVGDNPYFLIIVPAGKEPQVIDLDESGWSTKYAWWMRCKATWHLLHKERGLVCSMVVWKREQPYYTAKHIGTIGPGERRELIAYGIGKKRRDGHVDRIWILPNGQICMGDDVESLARPLLVTVVPVLPGPTE